MGKFIDIHTHHPTGTAIEPVAVGIHPWDAGTRPVEEIAEQAVTADFIGEIGLDALCEVDFERQLKVFREQLTLAEQLGKPVVLHCVRTFEQMMNELANHSLRAVIFHGFIGSPEQAGRAIKRGYFLSFGERTFHSPKTIEALRQTPLSQIFIETDESTTSIDVIYARIADLRGVTLAQLTSATNENLERILG